MIHPRALVVAAVILAVSASPSILEVRETWEKEPERRALIVGWYGFVGVVAVKFWRVLE